MNLIGIVKTLSLQCENDLQLRRQVKRASSDREMQSKMFAALLILKCVNTITEFLIIFQSLGKNEVYKNVLQIS